jgi:hypothetical protein
MRLATAPAMLTATSRARSLGGALASGRDIIGGFVDLHQRLGLDAE